MKNHQLFKRVSKKQFNNLLTKNKEDIHLIQKTEESILLKRTSVFQMPKPGSPAILLLSGGLDSIIAWEILTTNFGLHVYPLTVSRGFKDPQMRSIQFFNTLFKRQYSNYYHEPFVIKQSYKNTDFHTKILNEASPDKLLKQLGLQNNLLLSPYRGLNITTAFFGVMYLEYLTTVLATPVQTIFYGATADDGLFIPSQTYSFLRLVMLMLMNFSNNKDIQFASPYYEKSLGSFMKKSQVLAYGAAHKIPLEKTYSCDKKGLFHCGECLSCISRKYCFDQNHVIDKTIYRNSNFIGSVLKTMLKESIVSL